MHLRTLLFAYLLQTVFLLQTFAQGESCNTATALTLPQGVSQIVLNADGPSTGNAPSDFATGIFPGITHSDWYAFTPSEDGVISVSSCGGGADSYLFLHRGNCSDLVNIDFDDDSCDLDDDPGTNNPFASLLENVQVQAGTTYFIEWTNAWQDVPFSWTFTYQQVSGDVAMQNGLDFTRINDEQAAGGIPVTARILSNGPATAENIQITATVRDAAGILVDEGSTQLAQLLPNTSQESTVFTWTPPARGIYRITYRVTASNNDLPANDTLVQDVRVTDAVFALDDGQVTGSLAGIPEDTVTQGQVFSYLQDDLLRSVSAFVQGGRPGEQLQAEVYAFENDQPGSLLAVSVPITLEESDPGWLHFRFDLGSSGLAVDAGDRLLIALTYFSQGGRAAPAYTAFVYRQGRTWIKSKTTADEWRSLESQGQMITYLLRANNGFQQQQLTLAVDLFNQAIEGQLEDEIYLAWTVPGSDFTYVPMADNGDSTYSVSLDGQSLDTVYYLFVNGGPELALAEQVPPRCAVPIASDRNARRQIIPFEDESLPAVCYSACTDCTSVPCADPAALICERFESYDTGPVSPQAPEWTVQVGGSDALVSALQANSGSKSLNIDGAQADQNVLLDLGQRTAGTWELSLQMYVPPGSTAAYTILHQSLPEIFAAFLQFEPGGTGSFELEPGAPLATFSYPTGQWFGIRHLIDLVHDQARLYINDQAVMAWRFSEGIPEDLLQLAALNFRPLDANTFFFVDDIFLRSVNTPPANDLCAFAADVSGLLGSAEGDPQVSGLQSNQLATADGFDPAGGFACFEDQASLDNTLWFTFTGDGFAYALETVACNAPDYLPDGNTQMALYSGSSCADLQPVSCNETRPGWPDDTGPAGLDLDTEAGQQYYLMIDGFRAADPSGPARGRFCLQMTRGMLSGLEPGAPAVAGLALFPNPSSGRSRLEVELHQPGRLYLEVLDPLGRIHWSQASARQQFHQFRINLDNQPPGMYLLRLRHAEEVLVRPLILR